MGPLASREGLENQTTSHPPESGGAAGLLRYFIPATSVIAWDGDDYGRGSHVHDLVRPGRSIEIYDYDTGGYREITVGAMRRSGSRVIIEATDDETGDTREIEMDSQ